VLFALGCVLTAAGCAPAATQLIVVVDSDLRIPSAIDEVRLTVRDPSGQDSEQNQDLSSAADLPLTLSLIAEGEALGPVNVHAAGYLDGELVVERDATASLARGESRVLVLHLVASCVGVDCGSTSLTCTESGCRPRVVGELPEWTGRPPRLDAAAVPLDAPPMDGGDAGMPRDGSMDAPRDTPRDVPPVACENDADCDDGFACTTETCFENTCGYVPNDAACDDTNPCTDDRCLVGEGCVPTFNTAPCGASTCGGFGTCDYGDGCDEAASQSRTCTDHVCASGTCAAIDRTEMMGCSRDTDGSVCGSTSCGGYGACDWADTCDESATQSRTCTDPVCMTGGCGSSMRSESTGCTRDTDGMSCGPSRICGGGTCLSCSRTVSGSFGTLGMSDFIRVDGSGSNLTFVDYSGPSGGVSVSGVTFSGSVPTPIALWQIHASGNTLRLVDWDGVTMGTITVSGATVSGTHAPPCVASKYGCFPPYVQRVVGSGSSLQFFDSAGGVGTITFACP
jgi:hypothetical protein